MKTIRKYVTLFLAVVFCLGLLPAALAAEDVTYQKLGEGQGIRSGDTFLLVVNLTGHAYTKGTRKKVSIYDEMITANDLSDYEFIITTGSDGDLPPGADGYCYLQRAVGLNYIYVGTGDLPAIEETAAPEEAKMYYYQTGETFWLFNYDAAGSTGRYKVLMANHSGLYAGKPKVSATGGTGFNLYKKINKYNISYDAAGGSVPGPVDSAVYLAGAEATAAAYSGAKEGCTFGGWSYNDVLVQPGDIFTMPDGDVTLTAVWHRNTYTVGFNGNSGAAPHPRSGAAAAIAGLPGDQTAQYGEKLTAPADPTAEYYALEGWYKEAELVNKWDFAEDIVTDNQELHAKWAVNYWTVSFDDNAAAKGIEAAWSRGNIGADNLLYVTRGDTIAAALGAYADPRCLIGGTPDSSLPAYGFGGWQTSGGSLWDLGAPVTSDLRLAARWVDLPQRPADRLAVKREVPVACEVTAAAGEHGSVIPRGRVAIKKGAEQIFVFEADPGYEVSDVLIDGQSVGPVESYVFADLDTDHTIEVIFAAAQREWVNPFSDVKEDDWFYEAVQFVGSRQLFNGTGEDTFSPGLNINRAMLVTALWHLDDAPAGCRAAAFADVDPVSWYAEAVNWAGERGVAAGTGAGNFDPLCSITREQMAVMLHNYARIRGRAAAAPADLSRYADAGSVSSYALPAIAWARAEGLLQGRSATLLAPKAEATRAEAAALLMKFIESLAE